MDIKPIKNESEYRQALLEIDLLMDAELGTPEGELLDKWVDLVEAYEAKHYALDDSNPVEAIPFPVGKPALEHRVIR